MFSIPFCMTSMIGYRKNPTVRLKALMESPGLAQDAIGVEDKPKVIRVGKEVQDHFKELKHRFLSFKKDKYM